MHSGDECGKPDNTNLLQMPVGFLSPITAC